MEVVPTDHSNELNPKPPNGNSEGRYGMTETTVGGNLQHCQADMQQDGCLDSLEKNL